MTDERKRAEETPIDAATQGPNEPDDDRPGSPESSAPMTDSTDGGLDGGDPGVEE